MWKDPCPTLVNPPCGSTCPDLKVGQLCSCGAVCIPSPTSYCKTRARFKRKCCKIHWLFTGFSNKSKYQSGLSLMKHPFPVSRHHQAERSDISELITTTIFLWCFRKGNILLACLLFNSYVENESTLNFKGVKTLFLLFFLPPKPSLKYSA